MKNEKTQQELNIARAMAVLIQHDGDLQASYSASAKSGDLIDAYTWRLAEKKYKRLRR